MSRLAAAPPLLLLAALFGCGERAADDAAREEASARAASEAPAATAVPAADAALLPPGALRIERDGERYTVLAHDVAPSALLAELATRAGFGVEGEAGTLPERPLRLALRGVSLGEALRAVLRGSRYHVHYEFADGDRSPQRPFDGRPVVLTRVTVGELGAPAHAVPGAAGRASGASPSAAPSARSEPRPDFAEERERARLRDEADARERERADAVARDWRDPRPVVRLEAIDRMEPELDEDSGRLGVLLRDDPSPDVRSAAAERLAEGNPFAVADALLGALDDADPSVVASAVGALEDVYAEAPNPRIRERVTALREHRDPAVRDAVESFEEWIEE